MMVVLQGSAHAADEHWTGDGRGAWAGVYHAARTPAEMIVPERGVKVSHLQHRGLAGRSRGPYRIIAPIVWTQHCGRVTSQVTTIPQTCLVRYTA